MKVKKRIIIFTVVFLVLIGLFIAPRLRNKYSLLQKIYGATRYSESNLFNSRNTLQYSDLSRKLRGKISKEEFESMQSYLDVAEVFNTAYEKVDPLPKDALVVFPGLTTALFEVDNKKYIVHHNIVIGYDYFIKPVIIEWYVEIELYENLR